MTDSATEPFKGVDEFGQPGDTFDTRLDIKQRALNLLRSSIKLEAGGRLVIDLPQTADGLDPGTLWFDTTDNTIKVIPYA